MKRAWLIDETQAGCQSEATGNAPRDERVLIVDGESRMRQFMSAALEDAGFGCVTAESVDDAQVILADQDFDLVVCALNMPEKSGLVLVHEVQSGPSKVPMLIVTRDDNPAMARRAALLGANGYLVEPFSANELRINVDQAFEEGQRRSRSSAIEQQQELKIRDVRAAVRELERLNRDSDRQAADLLLPLSEAVGQRDLKTGAHIRRIGEFSAILARRLGMSPAQVESMRLAAPMHDVGKVAVPDSILLKSGPLDPEERELMHLHAEIGHDILAGSGSPLLDLASEIAFTHHERFGGGGYPRGLRGSEIPVTGRIVAIVDVFDALTSDRSYRDAMPLKEALAIMRDGRGTRFDPEFLDQFLDGLDEFTSIGVEFADSGEFEVPVRKPRADRRPDLSATRGLPDEPMTTSDRERAYLQSMLSGDSHEAEAIAFDGLAAGMSIVSLYAEVVAPALWQVGERWRNGSLTIADEHLATAITERMMTRVVDSVAPVSSSVRGVVMLAAPESQHHSLGLRMVGDVLHLAGFRVDFLGADVPEDALLKAIDSHRPDLVGLSCTIDFGDERLKSVVAAISQRFADLPVMVGGQAADPDSWSESGVPIFSDLRGASAHAEALVPPRTGA